MRRVKDVSEKFKHIQNCYNMTKLLKTKHTFMLSANGSNLQKLIFVKYETAEVQKPNRPLRNINAIIRIFGPVYAHQINKLV
jgi:hypothetical protein